MASPSSIVEIVSATAAALRVNAKLTTPGFLSGLLEAQHFEVSDDFLRIAQEFGGSLILEGGEVAPLPVESRLPAPICTLWWPSMTIGGIPGLLICTADQGNIQIAAMGPETIPEWIGFYQPGGRKLGPHIQNREAAGLLAQVALVWTLVNEPRFVIREPAATRQARRSARGKGFAVDAWTRVSWSVGETTWAKIPPEDADHRLPLHYRRGHYRRAEQHFIGALQRPDAMNPDHRTLWWQWIEGYWAGHPAFGVRTSYHAPQIALSRRQDS